MNQILQLETLGLVFFTALFLSLFIVPATIVLACKIGAVDVPKSRSSHSTPTTRLGGLGIAASLFLACLMFLPFNSFVNAFLAGLLIIIATGLIDDIAQISPRWKFLGQILAALAFIYLGGGSLEHLGNFLGFGDISLHSLAIPFTIFCMVGGMNAFNLSDGLDGLAAGLAAIAAVFFAYFAWQIRATDLLLLSLALLGAVMGFLRYNSYPARLFMGDCGSLTLGYVLAALLVGGSQHMQPNISLVTWVLVVSLPLLDTLLVMARRLRHGHSPFLPDRTHLHHRLLALGLTHPGVVAVMYVAMAFFGLVAMILVGFPDVYAFAALLIIGGILFGGVAALQQRKLLLSPRQTHVGKKKQPYTSLRQSAYFQKIAGRVCTFSLPISLFLLTILCFPALFFPLPELNRNEVLALLMMAGMVVFYSLQHSAAHAGMLHGSVYVSIFILFFMYNLGMKNEGFSLYLTTISLLALVWVAFKIFFRKNPQVILPSSFELLMLLLSWFIPFVLLPEFNSADSTIQSGRLACLQVLPFMLVTKIFFNSQPQGNNWVVGMFAGAMVVIAMRVSFG